MIALTFSLMMISAIGGSVLSTFPNNILFWMSLATVVVISRRPMQPEQGPQPTLAPRPFIQSHQIPT
jgi:hypothetical protein